VSSKKNIVYLGCSGFPYGLAEIQKILLISKCLVSKGNTVTVICKRGIHDTGNKAKLPELKVNGNHAGVEYVYTAGTPFRHPNFFVRNYLKIKGVINEIRLLRKMKKDNKVDYAILSTHSYYAVLYYFILSKLFGFKTVLNYVEYYSGVKKKWYQFDKWLNDKLYDQFAPRLTDSVFLISEFLISHLNKIAPGKRYLKIPNLTDVERFNGIETQKGLDYFLFCGDAGYIEIIKFIINSFEKVESTTAFLYLVIGGKEEDIQDVKNYIDNSICKDRIKFMSRLTDKELSTYYKNAAALLIPLRPTFQDKARFPHKIGEYLASGSPVVSTNYGEVKYYFKDMENMLIAESYDVNLFACKMQFAINNPEEVQKIAVAGKKIATLNFDYRTMAVLISDFFQSGF
jgi:glycosyltransferase involved in cell wall biosynthesis